MHVPGSRVPGVTVASKTRHVPDNLADEEKMVFVLDAQPHVLS